MKKDNVFISEELFLEKILEKLRNKIAQLRETCKDKENQLKELHKILLEILKEEHGNSAIYAEIAGEESILKMYSSELADYIRIETSPYFGKIIYKDESDVNDSVIYIGKKGIYDFGEDEIPVIDWRAPISEVYYNYSLGRTSFQSPEGIKNIDLKLKRTLKIRNSILLNIYDADFVLNDDILIDYINQSKGLVLSDIVATIQKEQNEIIRKPYLRNIIVQGVAGSGKTTVAVHRVSYLMYNNKERLNSNNVYIIAANPLFLNYITSMLPDLDVPVIQQFTMQEILTDEFAVMYKSRYQICEYINPIYSNDTFAESFECFIKKTERAIFSREGLSCFGFDLLTESQLQNILTDKLLDINSKARMLDETVLTNLSEYRSRIIQYISENTDKSSLVKEVRELFDIEDENICYFDFRKNYPVLKRKFKDRFTERAKSIKPEDLFKQFSGKNDLSYLSFDDIACRLLFEIKVNGSHTDSKIMYIVIDEAQDFDVVIYYLLKNMYPDAYFTLVGDIMQNIGNGGLESWNCLKNLFVKRTDYLEMNKSYRNTYEIAMFAKNVAELRTGKPLQVEPLKRHGEKVNCVRYLTEYDKKQKAIYILKQQKEAGRQLNAVICRDKKEADAVYNLLISSEDIYRINISSSSLNYGNFIMSVKEAKGLEFDSVIIWDYDDYTEPESKKLYVAMTRALHSLYIFTNNNNITEISNNQN